MWDKILLVFLSFVTGTAGGMGLGGGSLLVVLLSSFLGYDQKDAQKINIISFLPTALVALILHIKNDEVEMKTALTVALSGLVSAVLLAIFSLQLESEILKKVYGGLLLVMGIVTFWNLKKSAK